MQSARNSNNKNTITKLKQNHNHNGDKDDNNYNDNDNKLLTDKQTNTTKRDPSPPPSQKELFYANYGLATVWGGWVGG